MVVDKMGCTLFVDIGKCGKKDVKKCKSPFVQFEERKNN